MAAELQLDRRATTDRRVGGRRAGDRRHLERFYPVAILVALSVADLITTGALRARGGIELNPVGRWLIGHDLLSEAKLVAVAVLSGLLVLARPRRWIAHALWFVTGIYAAVIAIHVAQLLTFH